MEQTMPTITELFPIPQEAKKLESFLGNWTIEGNMTVEGSPLKASGIWHFAKAAAGWGIKGSMKMEIEGLGSYEEDDLVGFDRETGRFHLYTLTNSAAVHDHLGSWTDEDTLKLEYDGLQDGKKFREEITVRIKNPSEFEIHEVDKVEGQVNMTMDVTLRRSN